MFGQNKDRPPENDHLDLLLGKCRDEITENNSDYFLLSFEYLIQLGCYREEIADVVENLFE